MTNDKTKKIAKIISYIVLYIIFVFTAISIFWLLKTDFSLVTILYVFLPGYEIFLVLRNANLKTTNFRSITLDLVIPIISGYFYLFLAFANVEYRKENIFSIRDAAFNNIADILIWTGYFLALYSLIYLRRYFTVFAEANGLIKKGSYKFIRNPIYTGYIISAIGGIIKYYSIETIVIAAIYFSLFFIRAFEEEKLLEEKFGQEYHEYKNSTGRFLPKVSILFKKK